MAKSKRISEPSPAMQRALAAKNAVGNSNHSLLTIEGLRRVSSLSFRVADLGDDLVHNLDEAGEGRRSDLLVIKALLKHLLKLPSKPEQPATFLLPVGAKGRASRAITGIRVAAEQIADGFGYDRKSGCWPDASAEEVDTWGFEDLRTAGESLEDILDAEPPKLIVRNQDTENSNKMKATAAVSMIDLIKDPATHTWTVEQFRVKLGYKSGATITATPAWKQLVVARELARLEQAEHAYKRGVGHEGR